jgi:hypothetical protein
MMVDRSLALIEKAPEKIRLMSVIDGGKVGDVLGTGPCPLLQSTFGGCRIQRRPILPLLAIFSSGFAVVLQTRLCHSCVNPGLGPRDAPMINAEWATKRVWRRP